MNTTPNSNRLHIVPYVTMGMLLLYMLAVAASAVGLMVTGSSFTPAVIALELATALSTPVILLLFMVIPMGVSSESKIAKKLSVIFMACCMLLTSMVHFIQLSITLPMISSGIQVPTYLQVGYWPSVPMSVEYLAWGFFMGTAFLSLFFGIELGGKGFKSLKYTLLICSILCYMGLLGVLFINENCWYIAPMGYGLGLLAVCLEMIYINKHNKPSKNITRMGANI